MTKSSGILRIFTDSAQYMSDPVVQLVQGLVPGDRFDFDSFEGDDKTRALNEFEGLGLVLEDGVVGEVEICAACDGTGLDRREQCCDKCQGYSLTVDFGSGKRAYRG